MKNLLYISLVFLITLPWIFLRIIGFEANPIVIALFTGFCIVGGAFILSWACEVAQMDIPKTLAISFLALIAILPEYAVDIYFAWQAGKNPLYIPYATANMTGSNRLLIGFGWTLVAFIYFFKKRKKEMSIENSHSVELFFLFIATIYSFLIPLKRTLSVYDSIFLVSVFIFYIIAAAKSEIEQEPIVGPAEVFANLPTKPRKIITFCLFIFSGICILISAEPFAESLIKTGRMLNIEEFILVQWIAPLASETPEIVVACLFVLKANPGAAMGTLISSKVNQWTLLIGMLPLFFSLSGLSIRPMPLAARQTEEILLTSCQSAFAISIFLNLRISITEAFLLFILFITQLFFTQPPVRYIYSGVYILLTFIIFFKDYHLKSRSFFELISKGLKIR